MEGVIVLNADYTYLNIIDWRRAIKLLVQKKVEVLKYGERIIRGFTREIKVPLVVKLIKFVRAVYRSSVPLSKKNIFIRDQYICQYCGRSCRKHPTIDHIVPKSRGGKFSWNNVVTACLHCNQKKGSKLPSEAGMGLIKRPTRPTISEFLNLKMRLLGLSEIIEELWG